MHLEILVEDSSGATLLEHLLPKFIGSYNDPHTWRVHPYKGIGRLPRDLNAKSDPTKRILLAQLPRILKGYRKTPGIDAVVVVVDTDTRACGDFLTELNNLAAACCPTPTTMFRLAIEEIEAWYLGDRDALVSAYPRARVDILDSYIQDSVCGTWELVADAVRVGGSSSIKNAGWPLPGQVKHEWADRIGPLLDSSRNSSQSFQKLRDGLQRITK